MNFAHRNEACKAYLQEKKAYFFGCHYERGPFLEDNLSVECYPMFHNVIKAMGRWVNTTIFLKMQPVDWEIVYFTKPFLTDWE